MIVITTHILMSTVLIIMTTKILVNYIFYDVKGVYNNNNVLKILSILFVTDLVSKGKIDLHFCFHR